MFKVRYRTQIGASLHFAADVSIALNHIKDLSSAGATSIKVTDAKGDLFSVEALTALQSAELAARRARQLESKPR